MPVAEHFVILFVLLTQNHQWKCSSHPIKKALAWACSLKSKKHLLDVDRWISECTPAYSDLILQRGRILSTFTSQQWKHLSNEFLKAQQEKRHSWFKAGGTIKKFRAGLSIFSPIPK